VEHFYVEFGDPASISFEDIMWKNRQTDRRDWKPCRWCVCNYCSCVRMSSWQTVSLSRRLSWHL